MADLASTRVFGKLTVMHEAIVKANAEIVGDVTASKFIGDGSQLTDLPWDQLTGVPSTFAPSSHTHPWSQITGAPVTATRWPAWGEVTGKPSTFTPSAHTHTLSQITDAGNVAALNTTGSTTAFLRGDGTWATPPNTTYAEITTAEIDAGTASTLRTITGRRMKYALDKKSDTGHGHAIGDITGLQTALDSKANSSTQVIAGTGLSGGGTLAANRTLSVNYGTTAGTAAQGNDSRIVNAVPNSRQVIAGTGLTGGGTLAANRTLSVNFGTTAGTAVEGNDPRLSDSREWTAATVTQAEAEAGISTTRRAWTAQRVRQAIAGSWYLGNDKQHTVAAATGTVDLDLAAASIFDLTLTANTTLTVSNATVPAGETRSVVVRIRQGGAARTLTWWSGIAWLTSNGLAPAAPTANKVREYILSYDGENWIGRGGSGN